MQAWSEPAILKQRAACMSHDIYTVLHTHTQVYQPRTQGLSSWRGEKTGRLWSRDLLKSSRLLINNPR
jgi:hypothetical protein